MSRALLFHHLLLNMFRKLIHPSSGACDLLWIYFMCCIALVRCVLVPTSRTVRAQPPLPLYAFVVCVVKTFKFIFYSYSFITWQSEDFLFKVEVSGNSGKRMSANNSGPLLLACIY